jgi:hypothetical protein
MSAAEAVALVAAAAARIEAGRGWIGQPEIRGLPEVQAILSAPDELRRACAVEAAQLMAREWHPRLQYVLSMALRKKLDLPAPDGAAMIAAVRDTATGEHPHFGKRLLGAMIGRLETAATSWDPADRAAFAPLIEETVAGIDDHLLVTRLRGIVPGVEDPLAAIATIDDPGRRLRAALEASDEAAAADLLALAEALPASGKPSARWATEADALRGRLADPCGLTGALIAALLAADDTEVLHDRDGREPYTTTHFFHSQGANEGIALGIVRFAARLGDPALLEPLRRLALKSVTVVGGEYGNPRSLKLANASALAMAEIGTPGAITELLALERGTRHGTLLKEIRKAIEALASAQGLTRDELLERAVERHDLAPDGTRDVPLSAGAARIAVDARRATLRYVDPGGRERVSFPAAVKEADAGTLAGLRAELKDVRKTIAGERHRIDGLLVLGRAWSATDWRALYLDHPVTGRLARALVWRVGDVLAIPVDAEHGIGADGATVALPADAEVRLWHPIESSADEVRAWRRLLLDREIVQPVKQAFRECYVLTPAEEEARTYSNRFAGHVFRQVRARALLKTRGWTPVALAWWDDGIDHGVARRVHAPTGVAAQFFYDPVTEWEPDGGDLYPLCTSDQIRFVQDADGEALALADVPPLVFTEVMRDLDLVIGVTSVGADPEWLDREEGRRFEGYWNDYGFGELGAPAAVRRDVLADLLPRLAIADRCTLEDRWLTVRGEERSYRIHLGSGNVLMDPGDRYLCIVAARDSRANRLFLPFDDDPVLSLILSKAFLLADDAAITDPSIRAQLR